MAKLVLVVFVLGVVAHAHKPSCIHPSTDENDFSWIDCIMNDALAGGTDFFLPAGKYYLNRHFQLPDNVKIWGAGVDQTFIESSWAVQNGCGENAEVGGDPSTRIGFVLGSWTYIGKFTFVSKDTARWQGYNGAALCGGAVFETPGCSDAYCKSSNIGDSRFGDGGAHDMTVENVKIVGNNDEAAPQLAAFVTQTKDLSKPSHDIIIRGITMEKSWCDGINVHGATYNAMVKGNRLYYQGDDNLAVWSYGSMAHDITFADNSVSQELSTNPNKYWGNCVAIYGGGKNINVINTECKHTSDAGVKFADTFGGTFDSSTSFTIQGMSTDNGKPRCAGQVGGSFPPDAMVNNCPNIKGWSDCNDPCFVHKNCPDGIDFMNGDLGFGWYCKGWRGTKVDAATDFDHCCIHQGCSQPNTGVYNYDWGMWRCSDDDAQSVSV